MIDIAQITKIINSLDDNDKDLNMLILNGFMETLQGKTLKAEIITT